MMGRNLDRVILLFLIINKVATRQTKATHKYGIEVPRNITHALQIDRNNNTTFWRDTIALEMKEVRVGVNILNDGAKPRPGYTFIPHYMVFDMKMDLRRKDRLVANGSSSNPPGLLIFASVDSRDSVRIMFLIVTLNGLDVWSGDITNAFNRAPTTEKVCIRCGNKFGPEYYNRVAIVIRAIYGLRTAAASFQQHLADCIEFLDFKPCETPMFIIVRLQEHMMALRLIYTRTSLSMGTF